MIQKFKTAVWFARRPGFWLHGIELFRREFLPNYDVPELRVQATEWARARAVPLATALQTIEIAGDEQVFPVTLQEEGEQLAAKALVKMGGPGDLDLLYSCVKLSGAKHVLETGVAYGWSSLAILAGQSEIEGAKLVSVDMPYPKMDNESFVGIVVPERFRSKWQLVRQPDRPGVAKAISKLDGQIDLCHYDSDKSWWGRKYAYPKLWKSLAQGGIFISDDIQDNFGFRDLAEKLGLPFAVTESDGKFVGIIRKPTE